MSRVSFPFAISILLLPACSDPHAPDYGALDLLDVSGTVQMDNTPLPDVMVTFEDPVTGAYSYGTTDSRGRFRLQFNSEVHGTLPGRKLVRIRSAGSETSGEATADEEEQGSSASFTTSETERIPSIYNEKSEWFVIVSDEETHFELQLKPVF